jgi:hypothetical protein
MKGIGSHQSVAQQPQGRLPARSDAPEGRESEDFARRMACGKQK